MSTKNHGKLTPVADAPGAVTSRGMAEVAVGPEVRSVSSLMLITPALMLIMVLASMEQTVTATAMPTIIGELHGLEYYAWVSATYLLAATVVMPLYGRLAD
ncbi:MAG: MFS transporter, partial [Phycisphaerae bacterium]